MLGRWERHSTPFHHRHAESRALRLNTSWVSQPGSAVHITAMLNSPSEVT